MKALVSPSTRGKANAAADALGITMAQYLELLVQRDLFDTSGRPLWATEVFPLPFEPLPGIKRHAAA